MRFLRAIAGALLWIVASLVGLVAVILCVTLILLPLGLPLLGVARRLYGLSMRMFLPRAARHPLKTSGEAAKSTTGSVISEIGEQLAAIPRPDGRKARKRLKKKWKNVAHA